MGHTMQVKPADKDKKKGWNVKKIQYSIQMLITAHYSCQNFSLDDRKLFVGMISKTTSEDDLRLMFAPFGTIENATVLRDADKRSKGERQFCIYSN